MTGLAGCLVSYSPLNRGLGIPFSAECSVEDGLLGPEPARAARLLAEEALLVIDELVVIGEAGLGYRPEWEYIGRMFNLYSWRFSADHAEGAVRVVEIGGRALGVFAAFNMERTRPPRPGVVASRGRVPRLVLLQPRGEGEPPGQKYVSRNPYYAVEGIPEASGEWRISVGGLVREPVEASLWEFVEAALEARDDPFHCVTGWSVRGRRWEGVPLRLLLDKAGVLPEAKWVAAVSEGGYASVFPLDYAWDAVLVTRIDGRPLTREEGSPVRLFVPRLYGWKHTKWLRRIILMRDYLDGYWEALAYHERGLAAAAERFKVRNLEIAEQGVLPEPGGPRPPRRA